MQIKNNLLDEACFIPSPNCDERPKNTVIELMVIHGISLPKGEFGNGNIEALFLNQLNSAAHPSFAALKNLRVSAHLVIYRSGQITQFVPFNQRAWHAGISCFHGKKNCNDFSIGIELEGTDDTRYLPIQYEKLRTIVQLLHKEYPKITKNNIVGHSDIAPRRKTDPGVFFDWEEIKKL